MLKDHEKLIICVTAAGVVLGIDETGIEKSGGFYTLGNPVNLTVKVERTGSSIQLSSFVFPCAQLEITNPAIAVLENDMETKFREQLRKSYNAFVVQTTSGLILAPK